MERYLKHRLMIDVFALIALLTRGWVEQFFSFIFIFRVKSFLNNIKLIFESMHVNLYVQTIINLIKYRKNKKIKINVDKIFSLKLFIE
jgi:hypothetical protein